MLTLLVAASIFLNGVNIDGVKAQSFDKCRSVRLERPVRLVLSARLWASRWRPECLRTFRPNEFGLVRWVLAERIHEAYTLSDESCTGDAARIAGT